MSDPTPIRRMSDSLLHPGWSPRHGAVGVLAFRKLGLSLPGLLFWTLLLLTLLTPAASHAQYGAPRQVAILEDERINESSGVAASRRHEDLFWTHNDSGDAARIFAFDRQGAARGVVRIRGARAIDWEDMASFTLGGDSYLLLADVGDNQLQRKHCALYQIAEPEPGVEETDILSVTRFRFEDGPQNCEAVAVDPESLTVFLVVKRVALRCPVYALSLRASARKKIQIATRIATITLPVATAMDISADGRRAVVLTYGHAYEFQRQAGEDWKFAFARRPTEITMPARRQGEAICYSHDQGSLFLTSEQLPAPIWEVPAINK